MTKENKEKSNPQQTPKASTAFNLFIYRKELSRQKRRHVLLAKKKVELTENLVSECTSEDAKSCNKEQLSCLMRGVVYKQKLKRNLAKFDIWMKIKMQKKLMNQFQNKNSQIEIA